MTKSVRSARFAFAFSCVLVCASVPRAGGFYVDAARPNNSGTGKAPASAWKDFSPLGSASIAAGDTIYLKRGSLWERTQFAVSKGGKAGKPVVVTAYGDESLALPTVSDTSLSRGWVLGIGANHVVVEKIAVHAPNGSCVASLADSSSDLVVQDMEISDCQSGIALGGVNGAIVQRNRVENIHFQRDLGAKGYGAIGITLDGCRNVRLLGNVIRHALDGVGEQEDGGGIELFRTNIGIEISGNRAFQVSGFLEFGGLRKNHDTDRNVAIHHNIAIEAQNFLWCSVFTDSDSNEWGMHFREVYVDNNTMIQNRRKGGLAVGTSATLPDPSMIRVRNNIFVGDSLIGGLYGGPFERRRNVYWSRYFRSRFDVVSSAGESVKDPLVVGDTGNVTYSLSSSSPVRDSGVKLTYPSSLGTLSLPTIADGKPDIGALEIQPTAAARTSSERFEGAWVLRGGNATWNGWANAAGTIRLALLDASGRTIARIDREHGPGEVVAVLELPVLAGTAYAVADMDGFRRSFAVPPVR